MSGRVRAEYIYIVRICVHIFLFSPRAQTYQTFVDTCGYTSFPPDIVGIGQSLQTSVDTACKGAIRQAIRPSHADVPA